MLFDFLFWFVNNVIQGIVYVLPNYASLPLPQWVLDSVANIFGLMKLILQLPILRKLSEYFWLWFPVWLIIWQWNLLLKILAIVPALSGLQRFRTHDDDNKLD